MKIFLHIFIILLLEGCINPTKNVEPRKGEIKKAIINDTVSTTELPEIKTDTLIKISKPFELNGISCYWENHIIYIEKNIDQIVINLKNYKTKQTLLKESLIVEDSIDYNSDEYFNKLNDTYLEDLNFDGFKDFYVFSKGSMLMTSSTGIYLFNNLTKSFEPSEYLSALSIEKVDKKNRILSTYSFEKNYEINKKHYFDKSGKINYTEVITEYFDPYDYKIYEKIINGEVVKRDSIFISKE